MSCHRLKRMDKYKSFFAGIVVALAGISPSMPALGQQSKPLVVVELFTSQGCYSCPPAEKVLAERFIGRDDVIALELHVDYWDDLVYFGSKWKDPYSSNKHTQRQINYASRTGRGPFTPQAIIQGSYSIAGTNEGRMEWAIDQVKTLDLAAGWDVEFVDNNDSWQARIEKAPEDARVYSVVYRKMTETKVTGGENKGKTLLNHNVVLDFHDHGILGTGDSMEIGKIEQGDDCVLIIQRPPQGVVFGAWPCRSGNTA